MLARNLILEQLLAEHVIVFPEKKRGIIILHAEKKYALSHIARALQPRDNIGLLSTYFSAAFNNKYGQERYKSFLTINAGIKITVGSMAPKIAPIAYRNKLQLIPSVPYVIDEEKIYDQREFRNLLLLAVDGNSEEVHHAVLSSYDAYAQTHRGKKNTGAAFMQFLHCCPIIPSVVLYKFIIDGPKDDIPLSMYC